LSLRLSPAFSRARRAENLAALGLLFILLTAALAGVTSTLQGPNWSFLWLSLIFGLLLGWVLAIFRQAAPRAILAVIALGMIYILFDTVSLSGKLAGLAVEFIHLARISLTPSKGTPIDWTPLMIIWQGFFSSMRVVLQRIQFWVLALLAGNPIFDPVAASLVWRMLAWIMAAWAGWWVEARKNALLAVLPAILLSVGTLSYARRVSFVLYLMLGATLVLLATIQHDLREQRWNEKGVAYPSRKGQQIGTAAILVAVGLVLFAAITSSISIRQITQWFSELRRPASQQNSGLARSLGIIPAVTSPPDAFAKVRRPGLPRALLIGSGSELSRRTVMVVIINDLPSLSPEGQALPLYWRSFTYDVYTGTGWRSSSTEESAYPAGQLIQVDHAPEHILIQQTVHPVEGVSGTLYAAGEPVKANLPIDAAWRSSGDLFGIQVDNAPSYEVQSLIPVVDETALRAAGQRYPDWVRQRYLALPSDLPDRVKALAIELTASAPTPYDRARAIEQYLRFSFPYTLDVPRPPSDQDLVDFFLFDLKKGYCDYYASAMVVLARAAGMPARLAIGYASGTYNMNSKRFVVSEADAHSWVEVYFPQIGWVSFEPTASRPSLDRTQHPTSEATNATLAPPKTAGSVQDGQLPWERFLIGGLVLFGVLIAAWIAFDEIHLRHLSRLAAGVEIYQRIRSHAARLKVALEAGDTPYEFAGFLSARLQEMASQGIAPNLGLETAQEVQSLVDRIVFISYNPAQPTTHPDSGLLRMWQKLRWHLYGMRFLEKRRSLQDRFRGLAIDMEFHNSKIDQEE
jgi:transglutaminase-like putative cysteine protease